jgi:undecaprenyl-diphosphatase
VWLGSHELIVLLAFGTAVAGTWFVAEIADEVRNGDTRSFDRDVLLAFRHPGDLTPLGPPSIEDAARDITALGGPTVLTLLTLASGAFLLLTGKKHTARFVYGSRAAGVADPFFHERP